MTPFRVARVSCLPMPASWTSVRAPSQQHTCSSWLVPCRSPGRTGLQKGRRASCPAARTCPMPIGIHPWCLIIQADGCIVAYWCPDAGEVRFKRYFGHLFGLPLAVISFNRWSRFLQAIIRRVAIVLISFYFDDATFLDLASTAHSAQTAVGGIASSLGSPFSEGKSQDMASTGDVLGLFHDLYLQLELMAPYPFGYARAWQRRFEALFRRRLFLGSWRLVLPPNSMGALVSLAMRHSVGLLGQDGKRCSCGSRTMGRHPSNERFRLPFAPFWPSFPSSPNASATSFRPSCPARWWPLTPARSGPEKGVQESCWCPLPAVGSGASLMFPMRCSASGTSRLLRLPSSNFWQWCKSLPSLRNFVATRPSGSWTTLTV